jgi:hypothetical protein
LLCLLSAAPKFQTSAGVSFANGPNFLHSSVEERRVRPMSCAAPNRVWLHTYYIALGYGPTYVAARKLAFLLKVVEISLIEI